MKKCLPYSRLASLAVLLAAMLLLAQSDAAEDAARGALKLCAHVLIPSLFPYMVISSLIVSLGTADLLGRFLSPVCRALHLPKEAASAILLGALCGFPVGAKTACELCREGQLNRPQTQRLIAVANNTGPAFVIEVVGAHCWGSRGLGLTVYIAQILSALLIGVLYARICKKEESDGEAHADVPNPRSSCDILSRVADAVSSGAFAVLNVCGFVVFFAVALTLAENIFSQVPCLLPPLAAMVEFTSGVMYAARLGGTAGAFLTGFAVGWSGVSVFAQSKIFTSPLGVRLTPAAVCKAGQGILTGIAAAVYCRFFYIPSAPASTCIPVADSPTLFVLAEVLMLVLFCLVPAFFQQIGKRNPS